VKRPAPMERMFEPGPPRLLEPASDPWRTVYSHGAIGPAGRPFAQADYDPLPDWNAGPYRNDVPKDGRWVHGR
jgi:hypothetical protein